MRECSTVAAEVGDVVHLLPEALVLGLGDVAAPRILQPPEVLAEDHLLLVGDLLVVEDEHRVAVHPRLDGRYLVARKGLDEIDSGYFAHEHGWIWRMAMLMRALLGRRR
jgi:hypothetical protein